MDVVTQQVNKWCLLLASSAVLGLCFYALNSTNILANNAAYITGHYNAAPLIADHSKMPNRFTAIAINTAGKNTLNHYLLAQQLQAKLALNKHRIQVKGSFTSAKFCADKSLFQQLSVIYALLIEHAILVFFL